MPKTGIDKARALQEWKEHKHNSWLFFIFLFVVVLIVSAVGMRFLKPPAVISLLVTITVVQTLIFLNSGRIVIALMDCETPSEEQSKRLLPMLKRLVERSGLKYTPTLFVSKMEMPNAFAFGSGIMGGSGVAVTQPLLEILDDDEVEAVLAHEIGHIRSRDTALMTIIGITMTVLNNFTNQMMKVGRLALLIAIAIELANYFPRVVAAGITQLREYAADAYSAHLTGEVQPLISAFKKMEAWYKDESNQGKKSPLGQLRRPQMDELLLSHPNMSNRITMLKQLEESHA